MKYPESSYKKLFKQTYKKPQGASWPIYKRLLGYAKPFWFIFIIAVLANACYSGLDSLFVYLLKPLLDEGFVKPDPNFVKIIPVAAVGLFTLRSVANLVGNYAMTYIGRNVVLQFRQQIFEKLMHVPCEFYDKSSSGQLLAMIIYNTAQVASACTDAVTTLIQSFCLTVGLIVVMFIINWKISLMFFILFPLIGLLFKMSSSRLRRLNHGVQTTMGELTHTAEEAIEGYKVVRTFGGEDYETKKFFKVTKRNLNRELKIVMTKTISVSSVQLVGVAGLAGMIYLGTSAALHETLSAGGFTALLGSMMALLKPLKDLTSINATIQRGLAGAESIFDFLDTEIENNCGTKIINRAQGELEFNQVNFKYSTSDNPVLKNVSFKVLSGEILAIVGRSGSGKSSLVSLIPRFYDIKEGQILLDGDDIYNLDLRCLRRQIATVSQSVVLFNDTIFNNIAYGKLGMEVTEAEVIEAATKAHAMEFIENLPEGLQTMVGENGILLSGGQRQRIAIARAILKDAPILILDEATSALDTESERLIQDALEKVMKNRTTLVIAHRLSTIEKADKIVLLDKGEVLEVGTHKELISQNGHYAKLHNLQFKDKMEVTEMA